MNNFGMVNLSAQDTNTRYDNSQTTFTWYLSEYTSTHHQVVYPDYTFDWDIYKPSGPLEISNASASFNVPYNTEFYAYVVAKNKNGVESTLYKKIRFINKPPTILCYELMNSQGGYACVDGTTYYDCLIQDDSQNFTATRSDRQSVSSIQSTNGYQRLSFAGANIELKVRDGEGAEAVEILQNNCSL